MSLTIALGKERHVIDQAIIKKIGSIEIGDIDFYWVGGAFFFSTSKLKTPLLKIKDGKVELWR